MSAFCLRVFGAVRRIILAAGLLLCLASCERKIGWGVLLWADEARGIPSGTLLPVYVKSNIEQLWVAGIPKEFRAAGEKTDKFEVPFAELDVYNSKSKAAKEAADFGIYTLTYAETLQDGLPIREAPDNGAYRIYRLKAGEIVKILSAAAGSPAVGANGDPLPGEWLRVLTSDGTKGYCFSYRLRLFEHEPGIPLSAKAAGGEGDPDWEQVLSRAWVSEAYALMLDSGIIDLEALSRKWSFSVRIESGQAALSAPSADWGGRYTTGISETSFSFQFSEVKSLGLYDWQLVPQDGGGTLQVSLVDENRLAVQFDTQAGLPRTVYYTVLPVPINDLIVQETLRRDDMWQRLLRQGRIWRSAYYGTIALENDKSIAWSGFDRLVPRVIPDTALPTGRVTFSLFPAGPLAASYSGVLSFHFNTLGGGVEPVHFLYSIEEDGFGANGLRLEHVPVDTIEGVSVSRLASSPDVLYFYAQ